MSATLQDYSKEAHSLQGSDFRQKEILTYEYVRFWAGLKAYLGEGDNANITNNNPLVRYMQEATGEKTWWIQQERHNDPHLVIEVADTGVVHLTRPNPVERDGLVPPLTLASGSEQGTLLTGEPTRVRMGDSAFNQCHPLKGHPTEIGTNLGVK